MTGAETHVTRIVWKRLGRGRAAGKSVATNVTWFVVLEPGEGYIVGNDKGTEYPACDSEAVAITTAIMRDVVIEAEAITAGAAS